MPPAAAPRPFRISSYSETRLANGLTVVFAEDNRFPLVTVRLVVPAGTGRDPKDTPGVAAALAAMLMQGTGTRSARQLEEDLEACGCAMTASAGPDSTIIEANALAEGAPGLLSILGDILRDSQLPDHELDLYRRGRRQSLMNEASQPAAVADALFRRAIFGDDPYGTPHAAPDSVDGLDRAALLDYHKTYFNPNDAYLIIVGKLPPHAELVNFVTLMFGGWPPAKASPPALPVFKGQSKPRLLLVDRPGAEFAEIRVGGAGPAYADPDTLYLSLASRIAGSGADSRLAAELKGALGAGEDVHTDVTGLARSGVAAAVGHVRTASAADVLGKIVAQLGRISSEPVSAAELSSVQSRMNGAFPLDLESQRSLADNLARMKLVKLPKDYLEGYTARVNGADAARILAAAKKWLSPAQSVVVVVGDAAKIAQQLDKVAGPLGKFELVDAAGAAVKPADAKPADAKSR
jgi:zinc protease